jgi:N-acetylglutamate synthase-like GNAT family acetyltransferase
MSAEQYQVRRATVDDLPALRKLWDGGHLPALELDKRFTEFQLAFDPQGGIVGAIGLHIEKQQGLIHNEVYHPPELSEFIRPIFWERVINVARNHGLIRVWSLATTSFFRQQGMVEADTASLNKLPASFGHPNAGWLTLKLKEEVQPVSLDSEFAVFAQSQRDETDGLIKRAQFLRIIAYTFLTIVLLVLAIAGVYVIRQLPKLGGRR